MVPIIVESKGGRLADDQAGAGSRAASQPASMSFCVSGGRTREADSSLRSE
jgi:hypothetical protein